MNLNHLPDRLFDIISHKKFEELSLEEASIVREQFTEEEYNEVHQFLTDFQEMDQSLDHSIRLNKEAKQMSLWSRIIHYQIPLYKVAAGFIILMGSFFAYHYQYAASSDENIGSNSTQAVSIEDSFYPEEMVFEM